MAYTQPNPIPYRSVTGATAQPYNRPLPRYPLPDACPIQLKAYAFDQQFDIIYSSFPPADRNKASSDSAFGLTTFTPTGASVSSANAILTRYSQPSPLGGDMVQFEGTFHIVPASWDDFKLTSWTFPDFPGLLGGQYTRTPFTDNVVARVRHDYYVIDPDGVLGTAPTSGGGVLTGTVNDSSGAAVKRVYSLADIPIVTKTNFVTVYAGAAQPSTRINSLIKSGGDTIGSTGWLETCPTRDNYIAWIARAKAYGWNSTVWDGTYANQSVSTIGQFVIEDSHIENYAGNIIDRITTYILAK